jgi:hypothetical protein
MSVSVPLIVSAYARIFTARPRQCSGSFMSRGTITEGLGLNGGDSICFFVSAANSLYFCTNPLSRSSEAASDAVSINMRRRSARARQYSVRSIWACCPRIPIGKARIQESLTRPRWQSLQHLSLLRTKCDERAKLDGIWTGRPTLRLVSQWS